MRATGTVSTTLTTTAVVELLRRWGVSLYRIDSDATLRHDDGTVVYCARRTWRLTWLGRVAGWYRERPVAVARPGVYAMAIRATAVPETEDAR
jgi:hypothetical protein